MEAVDPRYHDPLLGVVFDLDGTLVLSDHPFERMRREVIRIAERNGVVPGHLSVTQTIPSLMEAAVHELERAGLPATQKFRFEAEATKRIDEIELEALPHTRVRPGALETVRALGEAGYRVGVLTRSSGAFAEAALVNCGMRPFVPVLRTRSDSGPAKPDPEALLLTLRAMGVPPNRAIFVGDHLLDAECASRARVRFYALLPPNPNALGTDVDRFKAAGATAIAVTFEDLRRQLGLPPLLPAT
jgi:HAD superfamily hydrolase (TIGR01549 family)